MVAADDAYLLVILGGADIGVHELRVSGLDLTVHQEVTMLFPEGDPVLDHGLVLSIDVLEVARNLRHSKEGVDEL